MLFGEDASWMTPWEKIERYKELEDGALKILIKKYIALPKFSCHYFYCDLAKEIGEEGEPLSKWDRNCVIEIMEEYGFEKDYETFGSFMTCDWDEYFFKIGADVKRYWWDYTEEEEAA